MARKNKKTKTEEAKTPSLGASRIEKHYTKIVIAFVAITVVLVGVIAYFSFSKTTIIVHPRSMTQDISLSTTLEELDGVMVITDVEGSKQLTELTSSETRPGKATGTVTLINNYSKDQPLVETTRLLSAEGVLFRTQETVTVPAGGSIDVPVIADEEGAQGNLGPTKFEVVALWDGLKDDIYGENAAPMDGGVVSTAVVTEENVQQAKTELRADLIKQGADVIAVEIQNYDGLPTNPLLLDNAAQMSVVLSEQTDVNVGDEASQVTATMTATVVAPVINQDKLSEYLQANIDSATPAGSTLTSDISLDDVTITVDSVNDDYTNADLTISLSVEMTATEVNDIFDLSQITNRSEADIRAYLTTFEEVESVEVQFSPFWVKRTPALSDNITIKVE
ncbi:MAG: baseplate J/gp47 family protein [Candidatus Kerfeldbacteria bacterium]